MKFIKFNSTFSLNKFCSVLIYFLWKKKWPNIKIVIRLCQASIRCSKLSISFNNPIFNHFKKKSLNIQSLFPIHLITDFPFICSKSKEVIIINLPFDNGIYIWNGTILTLPIAFYIAFITATFANFCKFQIKCNVIYPFTSIFQPRKLISNFLKWYLWHAV